MRSDPITDSLLDEPVTLKGDGFDNQWTRSLYVGGQNLGPSEV